MPKLIGIDKRYSTAGVSIPMNSRWGRYAPRAPSYAPDE